MATTPRSDATFRFGAFELDVRAGELRKRGVRLPLQGRPIQILATLVEQPGRVVTRDELRARLWPADTFVDFEHGLHNAIARLREALGDSANTPRYVETLPRRGYCFIATITQLSAVTDQSEASVGQPLPATLVFHRSSSVPRVCQRSLALSAAALVLVCLAAIIGLMAGRRMERKPRLALHQLTFRRGTVWNARFTPDSNSVIYGAAWEGRPVEMFEGRVDSVDGRALDLSGADVLAISSTGEMAVMLHRQRGPSGFDFHGMLALVPLSGGAPRPIMDQVEAADWGPDGTLAITYHYHAGSKARLEYPIGTVRYESATWLSDVRVSPDGRRVAFIEHDHPIGDGGFVCVSGPDGHRRLSPDYGSAQGLVWAPSGKEIWYTAAQGGGSGRSLRAVDLQGRVRELYQVPGTLKIQDVAGNGRVLLVHELIHAGILAHVPGAEGERELGWFDWSIDRGLSADGKLMVLEESGDAPGGDTWVYLRRTDGSPPVKLGSGAYGDLSPDGQWVAAAAPDFSGQINLFPTGPGQARALHFPALRVYATAWLPDGKRLLVNASESGKQAQLYLVDVGSGALRGLNREGSGNVARGVVSPDGALIAGRGTDGAPLVLSLAGGTPRRLTGLQDGERILGWTTDGKSIYAAGIGETENSVFVIDVASGRRQLFRTFSPLDKAGLTYLGPPTITADGRYYAYSYNRQISEMFVVEGIQ
ncbi:MAG TPA: winged helix-turn-helix domain-containing protein [Terriglobales bacterium]|nr:winged helix-turn-helix domain-containing protein [Terriglobales bacterium]